MPLLDSSVLTNYFTIYEIQWLVLLYSLKKGNLITGGGKLKVLLTAIGASSETLIGRHS